MGLLKPRTASLIVYHGDAYDRMAEARRVVARAEAELEAAEDRAEKAAAGPRRRGDDLPDLAEYHEAVAAARNAYNECVDAQLEHAVEVELGSIGWDFADLLAAHPPRRDDQGNIVPEDADDNVNTSPRAFPLALLSHVTEQGDRTILSPEGLVDELHRLPDGEFKKLWTHAFWLNRAEGVDPKDTKFSLTSQT